jgi:hypothetical protein
MPPLRIGRALEIIIVGPEANSPTAAAFEPKMESIAELTKFDPVTLAKKLNLRAGPGEHFLARSRPA